MSITLEPHQQSAVEKGVPKLRRNRILYLIFWMRKGKTLTALSICDECLKTTVDAHVLFVSELEPLPSIRSDYEMMEGPSFTMTVINYESLHKVANLKFNILIIDEAHRTGTYPKPNEAVKKLKAMAPNKPIIYLSATPTPETGSQIYHQLWISTYTPFAQWESFYRWAKEFVDIAVTKLPGRDIYSYKKCDLKKIWAYISHLCITVGEKEGSEINEIIEKILSVQMSQKCMEIYKSLKYDKIYINAKGQAAIANSGGELNGKLAQISSGTLKYDEDVAGYIDVPAEIIDTSKADFIRSFFFGKKIAIIYRFVAEGDLLRMYFPNNTDSWQEFQDRNDLTYIKQIRSARMGIRLDTTEALVMYNIEDSALSFIQGMARGQSMYRKEPLPVYWIFSNHGVEREIYENIKNNKTENTAFYYAEAN